MKKLLILLTFVLFLNGCAALPSQSVVSAEDAVSEFRDTTAPEVELVNAAVLNTETEEAIPIETAAMVAEFTAESEVLTVDTSEAAIDTSEPEPEPVPERGYIYLTFDDGPYKYTERVLEILDEYNVTATFFIVGQFADYYPRRVRAIAEAGHDIGCHSATHDYSAIYASGDAITADIATWEAIVTEALGEVPEERLYRFPGGSNCTAIPQGSFDTLHDAVNELGYRGFDWTCANNDKWYAGKREDQTLTDYFKESVISSLAISGETRIMLLHETVAESVEMLPWLIEYLQGEGYGFAPLSKYEGEYLFAA